MKTSVYILIIICLSINCSKKREPEINLTPQRSPLTLHVTIPGKLEFIPKPEKRPHIPAFMDDYDAFDAYYNSVDSFVNLINKEQIDISTILEFNKNVEFGKSIKIYSLDICIDGTRAMVHLPVIQWRNERQINAVNLSNYVECRFEKIIELNQSKKIYLLLGDAKADGSCRFSYAYVIQINKNKIDLDYPAFHTRPYLNLCNGNYTFDKQTNLLKFSLTEGILENIEPTFNWPDYYGKFSEDSLSGKKIFDKISFDYFENKSFQLEFDGSTFNLD